MHKARRLRITDVNPHLTCVLCSGYLIDATTVIECLHSFCRACIVKYLESNKYCPICDVQVHKTKPLLNIRSDQTLQDIVYKLVPGLFQNEMCRRREFYAKHPDRKPSSAEESGEVTQFTQHIYTADESISLSLEYYNNNNEATQDQDSRLTDDAKTQPESSKSRRFLRCPAAVTVQHLQKLIRAKYDLSTDHRVDILYMNDRLNEHFTLMDIAYIYLWQRRGPLHLTYRIFEIERRKSLEQTTKTNDEKQLENAKSDEVKSTEERNEWKEVQLQISENGIMSVTNINEAKPSETVATNVVDVNSDSVVAESESSEKLAPKSNEQNKSPTIVETPTSIDLKETSKEEAPKKEQALGKHKLEDACNGNESRAKVMKPNGSAVPNQVKNVHQLSRNHPLKIHSQAASKSQTNQNTHNAKPHNNNTKTSNNNVISSVQKDACTNAPQTVQNSVPPVQSVPKCATPKINEATAKVVSQVSATSAVAPKTTLTTASAILSTTAPITSSTITLSTTALITTSAAAPITTSAAAPVTTLAAAPVTTLAAALVTLSTTAPIETEPKVSLKYTTAALSSNTTTTVTSIATPKPNNCIQSSKVGIIQKKTPLIGYKTLRNPPKAWNPQVSRPALTKVTSSNSNSPSTSDTSKPDPNKTKPAKFFKMRNNTLRFLGNPVSGVKPMYHLRDAADKPETTANSTNNKTDPKPKLDQNKPQSIVKIDPKTLRPLTEKPERPEKAETPTCSDAPEMKINQSTVSIFNPLRTQKSQSSLKIDRRSPKSSTYHHESQTPPRSAPDRTKMAPNKKDKLNLNFITPSSPFIPNLASPNLAPNQFLYPNFASYDPRVMNNLSAYHNLPFSMFYSQPRLNYPGLATQNLPLSPSLMASLNLEVNKNIRKNYDLPSIMQQLSPTLELKKPATVTSPNSTEKPVETSKGTSIPQHKTSPSKTIKTENTNNLRNNTEQKQETNNKSENRLKIMEQKASTQTQNKDVIDNKDVSIVEKKVECVETVDKKESVKKVKEKENVVDLQKQNNTTNKNDVSKPLETVKST